MCLCDADAVDAHHITDRNSSEIPNGGYVKENGISLCSEHHIMAEKYHITNGTEWCENMHPDDLYKKIKSSKELAIYNLTGGYINGYYSDRFISIPEYRKIKLEKLKKIKKL